MTTEAIGLEPVVRTNLTTQVVDSIKGYITANDLAPGSKLPGERELARTLGVSRAVTREALKTLEAVGIVEISAGNGVYVSDRVGPALFNHISFALMRFPQEFRHLAMTRLAIEVGALGEVLANINDTDFSKLENTCRRLECARCADEYIAAEMEFHGGLIAASRNPLLIELCALLREFFLDEADMVNVSRIPEDVVIDANSHREILDALRVRDLSLARSRLCHHIEIGNDEVLQNQEVMNLIMA